MTVKFLTLTVPVQTSHDLAHLSATATFTFHATSSYFMGNVVGERDGNEYDYTIHDVSMAGDDDFIAESLDYSAANESEFTNAVRYFVQSSSRRVIEESRNFRRWFLNDWDAASTFDGAGYVEVKFLGTLVSEAADDDDPRAMYEVTVTRNYYRPCPHDDRTAATIVHADQIVTLVNYSGETAYICDDCGQDLWV